MQIVSRQVHKFSYGSLVIKRLIKYIWRIMGIIRRLLGREGYYQVKVKYNPKTGESFGEEIGTNMREPEKGIVTQALDSSGVLQNLRARVIGISHHR